LHYNTAARILSHVHVAAGASAFVPGFVVLCKNIKNVLVHIVVAKLMVPDFFPSSLELYVGRCCRKNRIYMCVSTFVALLRGGVMFFKAYPNNTCSLDKILVKVRGQ